MYLTWNENSSYSYADVMGMSRLERKLLSDTIGEVMQERKKQQEQDASRSRARASSTGRRRGRR